MQPEIVSLVLVRNGFTTSHVSDIWTPPNTPTDGARFELLVKMGGWVVEPMEVRVIAGIAGAQASYLRTDGANLEGREVITVPVPFLDALE